MSAISSVVSVPSSYVGDAQAANWNLQHVGSPYQATPVAVADMETQGFLIDAYGRLITNGAVLENAALNKALIAPNLIGGSYTAALPTLGDGDAGFLQMDSRGRVYVVDDGAITLLTAIDTKLGLLNGYVDGLEGFVDGLEGFTDGLEGLLTTSNASLAAIEGYTDGLETLITATNTKLDTVNTNLGTLAGHVDQLEGYTDQLEGYVDQLEGYVDAVETKLDTVITNTGGLSVLHQVYIDYSSSNLPGNASNILELVNSTSAAVKKIQVFDTGGVPFEIRTGALTGSAKAVFGPGADGEFECNIPAATRVGVRRLDSASALTGGTICINFLG